MGGVDKSDQLISYHRALRQTKRYWKTLFHLIEVAVTNSFILYKLDHFVSGQKQTTESDFRDQLVLQVIKKFGNSHPVLNAVPYRICHGSKAFMYSQRGRCVLCKTKTIRRCPDSPFSPPLCQTSSKDCHGLWHSESYDSLRKSWFVEQLAKRTPHQQRKMPISSSKRGPGHPKGSKDKRSRKTN